MGTTESGRNLEVAPLQDVTAFSRSTLPALSRRTSLPGRGAHFSAHHMLGGGSDPPQRLHHMLGGGSRPPQHLHHMLGGGSWPRTPPETRGQTLRALDFTPHFAAFSRGKSSFGATLALRLVRFSKILVFQPRFHNFGGKIGSLAAIPSLALGREEGGCI